MEECVETIHRNNKEFNIAYRIVCQCLTQFVCYFFYRKLAISVILPSSVQILSLALVVKYVFDSFHFLPPVLLVLLMVPIQMNTTQLTAV